MHGAAVAMRTELPRGLMAMVGTVLAIASAPSWSVAGNCTISTSPVTFGTYNVFSSTDLTANGKVTYNCNGASPSITIDNGGASSCIGRRMLKGSEVLTYNLYL